MIKGTRKDLNGPDLVPAGAFSYPVDVPQKTRWFGFLLLPQFTLPLADIDIVRSEWRLG